MSAIYSLPPDAYRVAIQHYSAGLLPESSLLLEQILKSHEYAPALQLRAGIALQQADAETARNCFERLLQIPTEHANSFLQVGTMAEAGGFPELAETAFRKAIAFDIECTDGHYYLAKLLRHKGRLTEAVIAFKEVIARVPRFMDAYIDLAHVLANLKQLDAAIELLQHALALEPSSAELFHHFAFFMERANQILEAETAYRQALTLKPDFPEPLHNIVNLLQKAGRIEEAEAWCRHGLQIRPHCIITHRNLGALLHSAKRIVEAEAAYRSALQIKPDCADTLNSLGVLLMESERTAEAETAYLQALEINPEFTDALHNLSLLHRDTGRIEAAERFCREALRLNPDHVNALNHAGILAIDAGCMDEAEACFQKVLKIDSDNWDAAWFLGYLYLLRGELELGWQGFEYRWKSVLKEHRKDFAVPRWDGQTFQGQTLLIHCEQGLGDSLQFVRYLPEVIKRGGKVLLECQKELKRLLETIPDIEAYISYGGAYPEFDLHCPLLSLPLLLNTRLDTIPARTPYLTLSAEIKKTAPRLTPNPDAPLKVGLAWAGNPLHKNDLNRSLCFEWLMPLFEVTGITWVILQQERRPDDFTTQATQHGWLDPVPNARDMAETAAVMAQLDLMLCIDSALLHLAGALNIDTWALIPFNPDWRWMLQREDSPWYPSMRLFRQPRRHSWPEVIEKVLQALTDLAQIKLNAVKLDTKPCAQMEG